MIKFDIKYTKRGDFVKYDLLEKVYYKNRDEYERIYEERKNSSNAISLELDINGNEAFYLNTSESVMSISRIYKKFAELNKLCLELPTVAYAAYERDCLIDEIVLTNDIEGVRSTRKEVIDVLDGDEKQTKKRRFDGMVWKYGLLLDGTETAFDISLNNSQDIRALYDEIVLDEISSSNIPDGKIFRKDIAEVVSGTLKVKHVGVHPEEKIIAYIDKVLDIYNTYEIPQLYKIAILHYMMGYIHPFYDGNGRLSRFISSYLLKREFNTLIALRLSYTIKSEKDKYYKAFDIANNKKNKGELTHFIMYFSQVIEKSIDFLVDNLIRGKEKLDYFSKLLEKKYGHLEEKEKRKTYEVLLVLIQNELFSVDYLDKKQLADQLKTDYRTANKYIEALIEKGAPIYIYKSGRKNIYKIDLEKIIEFLNG
ncbi:MAG: Fic family protein [Eubacterium sp.]|nr:Fic family protein [Eubacterium sp.]